jgi:alpha-glucosidase
MPRKTPWWRSATIYQIYVRSFRDSNGDGVGDLAGICENLDYLQWLGTDALWLSPCMPSPNADFGYDVADYFDVHPELGTLADLDRLIVEAARRDIGIMLDLVPNHTSSAHPWFVDARSGPGSSHRDYYVWSDPGPDGGPPNNWVCATGAPAWTHDAESGQYYLHNFLPSQPDLNWWHEPVHEEFEEILHFWFDRGVAGFRIDVAHGLYKDALLQDNPPVLPTDHPVIRRGKLRPVYSSHRPEVHQIYRRWRQIADGYEQEPALLGETWEFDYQRFGDYYGREVPELHMGFNFGFVEAAFRAPDLAEVVEGTLAGLPPGAMPVWTASNHDVGRFPTRWCGNDARAVKAALTVLSTLPGTLVLYYGDELGMADVAVPEALRLDEMTMNKPDGGRDRCRTPMPWSSDENAGFTSGSARPWLPLGEIGAINVRDEQADPGSVLNFWRQLAALRRDGRIGGVEKLERVLLDDQVWAYRVGEVTTVANLSDQVALRPLPGAGQLSVLASSGASHPGAEALGDVRLDPWQALVLSTRP